MSDPANPTTGDIVEILDYYRRLETKAIDLLARMKADSVAGRGPWPIQAEVLLLELTGRPSEALMDIVP